MNHRQVRLYVLLASTVLIAGFTSNMSMAQPSYHSGGLSGEYDGESPQSQSYSQFQSQKEESSHSEEQHIASQYNLNSQEAEVEEREVTSSHSQSNLFHEESQRKNQKKKRKSPNAFDANSEGSEDSSGQQQGGCRERGQHYGSHNSRKQNDKENVRIQQLEQQIAQQQETIGQLHARIDPLQYRSAQYQEQLNNAQQELEDLRPLGYIAGTVLRNPTEQQFMRDMGAMRFRHQQEQEALETHLAQEQEQQDTEDDNLSHEETDQRHNNVREELQQRQNEEWRRLPWRIESAYLLERPERLQQFIYEQQQGQNQLTVLARNVDEQKDLMDISNAVLDLLFHQTEEQNTLRARHDRENSMVSLLEDRLVANARGEQQRLATEALRQTHNAAQERLVQGFANRSRLLGAIVNFYLDQYTADIVRFTTPLLTPQTLTQRVHQQHVQIQVWCQQLGEQMQGLQQNLQQTQERQQVLEQAQEAPTRTNPATKSRQLPLNSNNRKPNDKGGRGGFGSMFNGGFGGSHGQL